MAISAAVFVGGIEPWKDALIARAQALRVGAGTAAETDVGPLISPEARDRAVRLIQSGVDQVRTWCLFSGSGWHSCDWRGRNAPSYYQKQ